MAALAAIVLMAWGAGAHAQATDREKALEERVSYLEEQLRNIEKALRKPPGSKSAPDSHHARPREPVAVAKPEKGVAQTAAPEPPPEPPPAKASVAASRDSQTAPNPRPPGVGEPGDAPQELNVLRENAVTLKPAGIEVSTEADYTRRETQLQNDRAFIATTAVRYGVLNWLELSATIPAGYSVRTSNTSPTTSVTKYLSGIGDLSAQANARIVNETANWPGVVVSLGFIAPTGPNPYYLADYRFNVKNAGNIRAPNPRNPLIDYFALGSWALHSNVQIYKTVDPIILFAGFGFDHVFPLTEAGYTVNGFNRLSYNLGMSFALSEKTTLGFSFNGVYAPNIKVSGYEVFQSASELALARFTVIQRIVKNVWLEPSISFGVDQDSPDFVIGLGVRARF
jgi:hypothetical protein